MKIRRSWLIVGLTIAADALLFGLSKYSLLLSSEWPAVIACVVLGVLAYIYGHLRPAPRLAALAVVGLQFVLFTNAAALLSYLLTGVIAGPLLDAHLVAIDRALGLDWPACYRWLQQHPALYAAARICYASSFAQVLGLTLALPLAGRAEAAREWFMLFTGTALVVVVMGAFLPAAGAYVAYGTDEAHTEAYVLQFLGVHDGTLRKIDLAAVQGIVQFPSFHAALAVLCVYAARSIRPLFWLLLPLNLAVIAATPYAGGHHFIDVFAGLALAMVAIRLSRLSRRHLRQDASRVAT